MEILLLLAVLVVLIMAGAPIGFTLILIPVVYILITDAAPMILIPSQMFSAIDSVPLTAIPFFMLTGELMTSATITDRLVELSKRIIGRMRGSMAQVNVLVSMFFAGTAQGRHQIRKERFTALIGTHVDEFHLLKRQRLVDRFRFVEEGQLYVG